MIKDISQPVKHKAIHTSQIHLLARLCEASAVSGDEFEVRNIILEHIKPHVNDIRTDALGNLLVFREGSYSKRLKVMLSAHMDEVGFMLTHQDDKEEGYFRFEIVGGINEMQLPGKPVWIGRKHIPGVIGAKPIHLAGKEELKNAISIDALRIDVGSGNSSKVKPGDRAVFATSFKKFGNSLCAKALDDRVGVVTLIELIKQAPENIDIQAAFTVQEEVGLRGARVAAYHFNPDIAIALDCTPANDMPLLVDECDSSKENTRYNTRLGAGAAIYLMDGATLSDQRLIHHFRLVAEELNIPFQYRQPGPGGTDAGAIHKQRSGIPSLSISVPGRYLHTAASLIRISDWQYYYELIHAGLLRLKPDILMKERK